MTRTGDINIHRYLEAIRLREAGATYSEVGKAIGVTRGRAQQMVKKAIRLRASVVASC